jgi:hypothetical protein
MTIKQIIHNFPSSCFCELILLRFLFNYCLWNSLFTTYFFAISIFSTVTLLSVLSLSWFLLYTHFYQLHYFFYIVPTNSFLFHLNMFVQFSSYLLNNNKKDLFFALDYFLLISVSFFPFLYCSICSFISSKHKFLEKQD